MHWLLRYARHHAVSIDPTLAPATALRQLFKPPAWRLLCRSQRADFLPILRNRKLAFTELVGYAERLVERGWQKAPPARFLACLIDQLPTTMHVAPKVPLDVGAMVMLRLACRNGKVSRLMFASILDWQSCAGYHVSLTMNWRGLVNQRRRWRDETRRALQQSSQAPWQFECGPLCWGGYEIHPLTTAEELWQEGDVMRHCVYALKEKCDQPSYHRFFSVRQGTRHLATLGLRFVPAHAAAHKSPQRAACWTLEDCRASCNRLAPEPLLEQLKEFVVQYTSWWRERQPAAQLDEGRAA